MLPGSEQEAEALSQPCAPGETCVFVDPAMCFNCSGSLRSITVWKKGPLRVRFHVVRLVDDGDGARQLRIVASGPPVERAGEGDGMVRVSGRSLAFAPGDCVAWSGRGIAVTATRAGEPLYLVRRGAGYTLLSSSGVYPSLRLEVNGSAADGGGEGALAAEGAGAEGKDAAVPGSVAVIVRSWLGELPMLRPLLLSCEWFLPPEWPVILVLDDDAASRSAVALGHFPSWVDIRFEPLPAFIEAQERKLQGWLRAMYTHFWVDNYTNATYVVICDADSVFHTFGVEKLVLSDGKPVIWGWATKHFYFNFVNAAGLKWVGEFMVYLPAVFYTAHVAELRSLAARRLGAASFAEAYMALWEGAAGMISPQALIASYVYSYRRSSYKWSLVLPASHERHLDWAREEACPRMQAMTHVKYFRIHEYYLNGSEYEQVANSLIHRGVCMAARAHLRFVGRERHKVFEPSLPHCPGEEDLDQWFLKVFFHREGKSTWDEEFHASCESLYVQFAMHKHYNAVVFSRQLAKVQKLRGRGMD